MRVCLAACASLSLGVALAACGPKVPQGNGYSTRTPWKKTKPITLTDNAGKAKGHLSYAEGKRAKWYTLDLAEEGDANLNLSFSPTDEAGDATVALEVLDHNYKVISEDPDAPLKPVAKDPDDDDGGDSAEEEDDDEDGGGGGDEGDATQKTRALDSLAPGRYYVHLFVTKRMDQADYELQVAFTPMPSAPKTDYPHDVAWVPALPVVPPEDDAPAPVTPPKPPHHPCKKHCGSKPPPVDTPPVDTPPAGTVTGDVIVANANGSGTDITINRGTADGLAPGRKGTLSGVKKGGFVLSSCAEHSCKATIQGATVTEVKSTGMSVTIK